MKANGKNLQMFKYSHQDYMDWDPSWSFSTWKTQEEANDQINEMRKYYNSGTISNPVKVTPMEFFMARQSAYWKGYEEKFDSMAEDCDPVWIMEYEFYVNHKDYDTASLRYAWVKQMQEMELDDYYRALDEKELAKEVSEEAAKAYFDFQDNVLPLIYAHEAYEEECLKEYLDMQAEAEIFFMQAR